MVSVDASAIELTDSQLAVLVELLTIYSSRGSDPVKGKEIAEAIDRNPGTIRTQMQSLKSLQLVKGIPGPKGGYEPTARAYEVVDLERSEEISPVPLSVGGEPMRGVTATELDLINLHHPDRREAEVYVQGSIQRLSEGQTVTVGPTPASGLVVTGVVDGVDASENVCILDVESMRFESAEKRG